MSNPSSPMDSDRASIDSVQLSTKDNPLRILLVEDSKGDAILIQKAIQKAMPDTQTIHTAGCIEEAIQAIESKPFDVALLDRSLPDAQGFSGLYSLQNMSPKLPVIFLTGHKDEKVACEAIEQGAQDYLFKDKIEGSAIRRAMQYAILRKQFENKLILRANYDMLTGLANRMVFESRLDLALAKMARQDGIIALLFLDLDRFKQVNDELGHAAGDELLKEVGRRLKDSLRTYDTAARFGGDEFAILMEDIPAIDRTKTVAKKIIELIEEPFTVSGKQVDIGVSIGIATCLSADLCSREEFIERADSAMYEAKRIEGNAYHTHESATDLAIKQAK